MKQLSKHIFVLKFAFITTVTFAIIILSAKFFLVPEIHEQDLIIRFYLSSAMALVILLTLATALVFSYVVVPERTIKRQIKKALEGDLSIDPELDDYGVFEETEHEFRRMKANLRKKMEKLQFACSYLEAVLLNMSDGVMVLDGDGKIVLVNKALKDSLRFSAGEVGKRPIEVIRNAEIQSLASEVLGRGEAVLKKEMVMLLPAERSFIVNAAPIIRDAGPEGAVLVFHDRTLQRKYEQMRKDFVANVSHELRTPISNIKGYVESLLEGAMSDPEHAEDFLRTVQLEADRLGMLIADLLDISRLESGRLELKLEQCDLCAIVASVSDKLRQRCNEKNMVIQEQIPEDARYVRADEGLLFQVLFNLLDNAVKYALPGDKVKVTAVPREEFIRVDVEDNGPGIPEDSRDRIFERFYRVDKARSRDMGGTGLGLSIVKHIVQEHGGEVWLERSSGPGSIFSFTVPRVK